MIRTLKWWWRTAHNDQRWSWIGHGLVCVVGSTLFTLPFSTLLIDEPIHTAVAYLCFSTGFTGCFLYRELIKDTNAHLKAGDWDKLDKDVNVDGKARRGVTPRYDKVGDLTGPLINEACAGMMTLLIWATP